MKLLDIIPSIHKEGYYFIVIFLLISVVLNFFSSTLGFIGLVASLWCVYFFRDPVRVVPLGDELIVSPADGIICDIKEVPLPEKLVDDKTKDLQVIRVSIFLNVFDVHVNRVPASGKIKKLFYYEGKFLNASLDKASIYNERQEVLMEMKSGQLVGFSQIAGLIARRIVCDLKESQEVLAGQRFGIIRFGSRMDVYLPKGVKPLVSVGQRTYGGETVIADVNIPQGREGEVR